MHSSSQRALEVTMNYENEHGRNPALQPNSSGVDIKSKNRYIEVKGVDVRKNRFILFSCFNYESMMRYKNFYLYVVAIKDDKKEELYILKRNALLKMIEPYALNFFKSYNRQTMTRVVINYSLRLTQIKNKYKPRNN